MKTFQLKPKLFDTLRNYTKTDFMTDLMAGIIVGIVALPLAIAFGIASGVSPEKGIITAIVAGFIISFLGGSKVQIGGPTGAFIVIIYGIIQQYGIEGLMVATMMAGVLLIILGIFKLGTIIKFIPYPIVSLPYRGRLYERYRRNHFHDPDSRHLRASVRRRKSAGRLYRQVDTLLPSFR